jgi:hypothetical protein
MMLDTFIINETDHCRFFVFCSLSTNVPQFDLIGSTLRIEPIGRFLVSRTNLNVTSFTYCLETIRLGESETNSSSIQSCLLTVHIEAQGRHVLLTSHTCHFMQFDENTTVISNELPAIWIHRIDNQTHAHGSMVQASRTSRVQIDRWHRYRQQVESAYAADHTLASLECRAHLRALPSERY